MTVVKKTHVFLDSLLDLRAGLHNGLPGLVHGAVQESAEALRTRQRLRGNCWQTRSENENGCCNVRARKLVPFRC